MTNMTDAFYNATANIDNWEDGEICMGDVRLEVYGICVKTEGMDPADFEHAFVELEEEYMENAYEDDKILVPRVWDRLTSN
jgi:hypothetical protein